MKSKWLVYTFCLICCGACLGAFWGGGGSGVTGILFDGIGPAQTGIVPLSSLALSNAANYQVTNAAIKLLLAGDGSELRSNVVATSGWPTLWAGSAITSAVSNATSAAGGWPTSWPGSAITSAVSNATTAAGGWPTAWSYTAISNAPWLTVIPSLPYTLITNAPWATGLVAGAGAGVTNNNDGSWTVGATGGGVSSSDVVSITGWSNGITTNTIIIQTERNNTISFGDNGGVPSLNYNIIDHGFTNGFYQRLEWNGLRLGININGMSSGWVFSPSLADFSTTKLKSLGGGEMGVINDVSLASLKVGPCADVYLSLLDDPYDYGTVLTGGAGYPPTATNQYMIYTYRHSTDGNNFLVRCQTPLSYTASSATNYVVNFDIWSDGDVWEDIIIHNVTSNRYIYTGEHAIDDGTFTNITDRGTWTNGAPPFDMVSSTLAGEFYGDIMIHGTVMSTNLDSKYATIATALQAGNGISAEIAVVGLDNMLQPVTNYLHYSGGQLVNATNALTLLWQGFSPKQGSIIILYLGDIGQNNKNGFYDDNNFAFYISDPARLTFFDDDDDSMDGCLVITNCPVLKDVASYWNIHTNQDLSSNPALTNAVVGGLYPPLTNTFVSYNFAGDGALLNLYVSGVIINSNGAIGNSLYLCINNCSNITSLVIDDGGGTNVCDCTNASAYAIQKLLSKNWLVTTNGGQ